MSHNKFCFTVFIYGELTILGASVLKLEYMDPVNILLLHLVETGVLYKFSEGINQKLIQIAVARTITINVALYGV